MKKTFLFIRILFISLWILGSSLMLYVNPEIRDSVIFIFFLGIIQGIGPDLVRIVHRKFFLSNVTTLLFALATGMLVTCLFFVLSVSFSALALHFNYFVRICLNIAFAAIIATKTIWLIHLIKKQR